MLTPEQYKALLRLVIKHDRSDDVIFGVINDFACLIEEKLSKCAFESCSQPATVKHAFIENNVICDSCAAKEIYAYKLNKSEATDATLERWIDMPNAIMIRRIREYVDFVKKNDVLDITNQLH